MKRGDYEEVAANFQAEMDALTKRMEKAEPADRADIEGLLFDLEKRWRRAEEKLWMVSDVLIARYLEAAPHIVVYKNSMNGGLESPEEGGAHQAIAQYLAGRIDREALIRQLDREIIASIVEG